MKFRTDDGEWTDGKLILEGDMLSFYGLKQEKSGIFGKLRKNENRPMLTVPLNDIKDVRRTDENMLVLDYKVQKSSPAEEWEGDEEDEGEQDDVPLASVHVMMSPDALKDLERELVMRMNLLQFSVYFTHAGRGGVLSLKDHIKLQKGIVKISNKAMWIIGREDHKRIAWDSIVNVDEKKRSRYKGVVYAAISVDYFEDEREEGDNVVVSSIIISVGDTITTLRRHIERLLSM